MREYYVFEKWNAGAPSVHDAACPTCTDGSLPGNGKWHGPYADILRAQRLARVLGPVRDCETCHA